MSLMVSSSSAGMISRMLSRPAPTSFSVSSMRVPRGARKCSFMMPASTDGKKSVPMTGTSAPRSPRSATTKQPSTNWRVRERQRQHVAVAVLRTRSKPRSNASRHASAARSCGCRGPSWSSASACAPAPAPACATGGTTPASPARRRGQRREQEPRRADQQHDREEHDADRQRGHDRRLRSLVGAVEDGDGQRLAQARLRWMFSTSTVASSTSMPMASARPPRVMMLMRLAGEVEPDDARRRSPAESRCDTITMLRQLPRKTGSSATPGSTTMIASRTTLFDRAAHEHATDRSRS